MFGPVHSVTRQLYSIGHCYIVQIAMQLEPLREQGPQIAVGAGHSQVANPLGGVSTQGGKPIPASLLRQSLRRNHARLAPESAKRTQSPMFPAKTRRGGGDQLSRGVGSAPETQPSPGYIALGRSLAAFRTA
jgi:hypothetical protein